MYMYVIYINDTRVLWPERKCELTLGHKTCHRTRTFSASFNFPPRQNAYVEKSTEKLLWHNPRRHKKEK